MFFYNTVVLGRRIQRSVGSTDTRFVHDFEDILLGLSIGDRGIVDSYTHGPGFDEPLISQGQLLQTDARGNVQQMTNGRAATRVQYNAFGGESQRSGNARVRYGFQSREVEEEATLYYFRARFYSSEAGRFISEDPIGFSGGVNLYGFVGNNPVNHSDPYGLARRCLRYIVLAGQLICVAFGVEIGEETPPPEINPPGIHRPLPGTRPPEGGGDGGDGGNGGQGPPDDEPPIEIPSPSFRPPPIRPPWLPIQLPRCPVRPRF